jgi:hypothetical protein
VGMGAVGSVGVGVSMSVEMRVGAGRDGLGHGRALYCIYFLAASRGAASLYSERRGLHLAQPWGDTA